MEKLTIHIAYFYIQERMKYVNKIINETNLYELAADIFIHTNNNHLKEFHFNEYTNGHIQVVYHDLSNCHPFFLTWKCRELMQLQKNDYDYFMYIEDDVLIPYNAIKYWLKHHPKLEKLNYNLGFLRIEIDSEQVEYMTDIPIHNKFSKTIDIDGQLFIENNINPYCAFWIYNKDTFHKFTNSPLYHYENMHEFENTPYQMIREKAAIGLNGLLTKYYSKTLIPLKYLKLDPDCRVYHLPNNYVGQNAMFATIPFDNAIESLSIYSINVFSI